MNTYEKPKPSPVSERFSDLVAANSPSIIPERRHGDRMKAVKLINQSPIMCWDAYYGARSGLVFARLTAYHAGDACCFLR